MNELKFKRYLINLYTGEVYRVLEHTTLGRHPENHIVLKDPLVSARHLSIRRDKGRCFVTDLKSFNHTYINDNPIEPNSEIEVELGDKIKIGEVVFIFSDEKKLDTKKYSKQAIGILTLSEMTNGKSVEPSQRVRKKFRRG